MPRGSRLLTAAATIAAATAASAQDRPTVAPPAMQAVAPGLADYTDDVLFGDVWIRPELAPRDRSLVTLSVLIATGKTGQMTGHLGRGLDNGLTPAEIAGLVTHLAFYTGWPNAVSALPVIEEVLTARGVDLVELRAAASAAGTRVPAPDRPEDVFAGKFAELDRRVIEGSLWARRDLSARDRSLATIAALAAAGAHDRLAPYVARATAAGLGEAALGEALTHLAFYAGWPQAEGAIAATRTALADGPGADARTMLVTPAGRDRTAVAPDNFIGSVTLLSPIPAGAAGPMGGATVRFEAGARTNWHSHPGGQLLVVTDGRGWVQAEGSAPRAIGPGDVVWTPPGVSHWHGATRADALTHVALSQPRDGRTADWGGPVADADYPRGR